MDLWYRGRNRKDNGDRRIIYDPDLILAWETDRLF